ncbi:MAG: hypothetical protein ACE5EU_11440 [Paracoccaceae bacterium]
MTLSGCASAKLFSAHPAPESAEIVAAPWPRLADTPEAPAKGSYDARVPDPAAGRAMTSELGLAARAAGERAEALAAPVLTEAERRRLTGKR